MAKGNKINNFNRTASHRRSMIRNMALSLIHYEVISTTDAKAKAVKDFFEKLMVRAKKDEYSARNYMASITGDKLAIKKVFDILIPRYADRATGFVSIKKIGVRASDSSNISEVSLVDGKKVLHIIKNKKAKKAKQQAKQAAKPKTDTKTKEVAKKAEKVVEKKQEAKKETVVKTSKKAVTKEEPKEVAAKSAEVKEEVKKEEPKENLAQRLGKFLGFRNRSSVKPEDEK